MSVNYSLLETAKQKMLNGDFKLATSYYERAISEDVPYEIVKLRYLTKNYLVYPLEYEASSVYFEHIGSLRDMADRDQDFVSEYTLALGSLVSLKKLFLRSVSLFYFSDIEVCQRDSVIVGQIAELRKYLSANRDDILTNDIFEIKKYLPKTNFKKLARDFNIIEAYCLNILLSYTAVQDSAYLGKRYSATTIDYGYFASTSVSSRDEYLNWAVLKPRMYMLGLEAYYDDMLGEYKKTVKELGGFDSPKELRRELTELIKHKYKKDENGKEFFKYAKYFEKDDYSRESYIGSMLKISHVLNPLTRLNPMEAAVDKKRVCSFELDNYFPRKMIWGVCDMLSAGQGWSIDTVRWCMMVAACFAGLGVLAYIALAIMMRLGFYWGVTIEKH